MAVCRHVDPEASTAAAPLAVRTAVAVPVDAAVPSAAEDRSVAAAAVADAVPVAAVAAAEAAEVISEYDETENSAALCAALFLCTRECLVIWKARCCRSRRGEVLSGKMLFLHLRR